MQLFLGVMLAIWLVDIAVGIIRAWRTTYPRTRKPITRERDVYVLIIEMAMLIWTWSLIR